MTRDLGLLAAELVDIRLPLLPRLCRLISPGWLVGVDRGNDLTEPANKGEKIFVFFLSNSTSTKLLFKL